jgi:hypothetical protein
MASAKTATRLFDEGAWAPPVELSEELPELAPEGQLCFVKSEDAIYERRGRSWVAKSVIRSRRTA